MSADPTPEPYVGPRPFGSKERQRFFGRDRESDDLVSLVLAHPVMLVYAASGAGKSSLLNAGLIPRLQDEKFHVLGSGRVAGPIPVGVGPIANAYLFHALSRWNSEHDGLGLSLQELAGITLQDFLQRLDQQCPGRAHALIFDQFEEFFTYHVDKGDERRAFIDQIAASLRSGRRLRIVFAMREEYVVQFEPFVYQLPEQLRTRMRLEPLRNREATDAIRKPVEALGLEFERGKNDPVEALVTELRKIHVDGGPNGPREVIGEFVEPLQLQVVCQDIWSNLPLEVKEYAEERQRAPKIKGDKKIITSTQVQMGDVNDALAQHYDRAISSAVDLSAVSEGELRRWFSGWLISDAGMRRIAVAEDEYTRHLPIAALEVLKEQRLIRAETRGGSVWYELSHDRFIEPIQASNRAWFERRAPAETLRRKLESKASIAGARLDEVELREAEQFLQTPEATLLGTTDAVKAFVRAGRERVDEDNRRKKRELEDARKLAETEHARAEEQERAAVAERALSARARRWTCVATLLAGIALIAGFSATFWARMAVKGESKAKAAQTKALQAQKSAEVARLRASVRQLAGQAFRKREDELDLALLLAIESRTTAEELAGMEFEKSVALTDATSSVLFTLLGPPGLQRVMHGHAQPVQSVALSADGKMLASGDMDGVVRLWATNGMTPSRKLESKFHVVYSVAFSPDGQILAVSGNVGPSAEDNGITLWKVATAWPFGGVLQAQGRQVVFSPDGKYLASPSGDKIVLWCMPDLAPSQRIELQTGDKAPVNRLAFSPNLETLTLAAGGEDQVIRLWSVATRSLLGTLQRPLSENFNQLYSLAFDSEGNRLASGWLDKKIVVWDLKRPDAPEILAGHSSPVFALTFSSDGKSLVSGGTDRTVQRWNLSATPKKPESLSGYAQEIYSLAADKKNDIFAGTGKGTIAVWNLAAKGPRLGERIDLPLNEKEFVRCVSLLGEHGQMLAFGSSTGKIFLWNLAKAELSDILVGHTKPVLCIASSSDGENWASGSEEGIIFWNAAGEPRGKVHNEKGAVSALAFRPDGQVLASNSAGAEIVFWDVAGQIPLDPPLVGHAKHVNSLAFSSDGKQLAAGDADEKVFLWDATMRTRIGTKPLCEFDNPSYSPVLSVAFSSKGQVAAAGRDPKIIVCNTTASDPSLRAPRLEKHKSEVQSLAFSPDGQILASASQDGTLILWDVPSGQFIYSLLVGSADAGKQKPIFGVAFSSNGSRLVSAGSEVLVWDLSLEGWLERASFIAGRNFTEDEWGRFLPDEKYRPTFDRGLLMEAHEAALRGDFQMAEKAYRDLTQRISQGKNAELDYQVGIWGILDGFAPVVAPVCENAVAMAPPETAWEHRDVRGVARALTGRTADAIEDLEAYVQRAEGEKMHTREAWLEKLKAGQNPFDAATLEALRSEY